MQNMDPRLRHWRWRVFSATWLCYAGYYFCRKPFFTVKADLGDAFGFDATSLGMLGILYSLAYTIGQFAAGYSSVRHGPRIVLLVGMAASIGCNIAFGFSDSYATFASFIFLNGLAQATGWSATVGTMGSWFHRGERGAVMGVWATNYQIGSIAASAMAAWVAGQAGFQYSFFAGSAVLIVVWTYVAFNQRNRPEDLGLPTPEQALAHEDPGQADEQAEEEDTGWSREVLTSVVLVGAFYFGVKFIRYAIWSWAPFLLSKNFGLDIDDAGYIPIVFDVAGVLGVIVTGFLSDRLFGGRRTLISFIMILGMVASCFLLTTIGSQSPTAFAICLGLIGFTLYGPDALMTGAAAIDIGSRKRAAMAAGIINGMGQMGAILQEFLIGDSYDSTGGDLDSIFVLLLGSATASALFLAVILLRNRKGVSDV